MREWKTGFHHPYIQIFCFKYHWLDTVGYQGAVEPIVAAHWSQAFRKQGSVDRGQSKLEWTYIPLELYPHTTFMQFITYYWQAHAQNASGSCFSLSAYCFMAGSQFQKVKVFDRREKHLRALTYWPTITKGMRGKDGGVGEGVGDGDRERLENCENKGVFWTIKPCLQWHISAKIATPANPLQV